MGLREQILAVQDRPSPEKIPVPEWNLDVYIRVMSGEERDSLDAENYPISPGQKEVVYNRANARARLLVRCLCDEKGNRIFADADAEMLGQKSGSVVDRLYDRVREINKLTSASIKETVKNSKPGQSDSSTSV